MPEAMVSSRSPTTSDRIRLSEWAGYISAAMRPPLSADRCLRTQFNSPMVAPAASNRRVVSCLSARLTPSAGAASSAEPPPDTTLISNVSAVARRHSAASARPAAALSASGTGCPASSRRMRRSPPPLLTWPRLVTATPPASRSPSSASTARAMGAAALPTPSNRSSRNCARSMRRGPSSAFTTRVSPCRPRRAAIIRSGSTRRTPAA